MNTRGRKSMRGRRETELVLSVVHEVNAGAAGAVGETAEVAAEADAGGAAAAERRPPASAVALAARSLLLVLAIQPVPSAITASR